MTSQEDGSFVRAMSWAPEGGCGWKLKPGSGSAGALRLDIAKFDLEPYPAQAVGDKVIIQPGEGPETELFVEVCETNDTCNSVWQTGSCTNSKWE